MPYIPHHSGSATGETYTYREQAQLGRYFYGGGLHYKDTNSFFCTACGRVINVECPRCKLAGPKHEISQFETTFEVQRPIETRKFQWFNWVMVRCISCDYQFQVIVR